MLLYKYRSLSKESKAFTLDVINKQVMYFSNPDKFNDPFEFRPLISLEASDHEFAKYLDGLYQRKSPLLNRRQRRESIATLVKDKSRNHRSPAATKTMTDAMFQVTKMCGVLCLSDDPSNILMWAHYGDNHNGICFGFDGSSTNAFFGRAQKVNYSSVYPTVNIIRDHPRTFHERSVLTKSDHWAYEREWRIIEHEKGAGVYRFSTADLKEVIFGLNTVASAIEEVKAALGAAGCKPRLLQATRHPMEYKLSLIDIDA